MGDEEQVTNGDEAEPTSGSSWDYRFKEGKSLGRFKIVSGLSHGSFGEVYAAKGEGDFRYNVRWIPGISEEAAKTLNALCAMPSRHVLNVLEARGAEGGAIVATEPFPRTLRDALAKEGRFAPEIAGDRISTILEALSSLEDYLIPLVVSPESIAVWDDGCALDEYYVERLHPRDSRLVPLDRATYLAPDLDPREPRPADSLYGVGAILYEMLTGAPHLTGPPFEVIYRAARGDFRVEIPGPLGDIVRRLLAPRAAQRFSTAGEVLRLFTEQVAAGIAIPEVAAPLEVGAPGGQPEEAAPGAGESLTFVETNEQGFKVFLRGPDGARMVLLPGGPVTLGSARAEEFDRPNEAPPIEVTVGPFLIDETPVTWEQLLRMLDRARPLHALVRERKTCMPSAFGGEREPGNTSRWHKCEELVKQLADNQPAILVTHEEARQLGESLGLKLPSEAQWEYAYRGGMTSEYYWGEEIDAERAWFEANAQGPQVVRQMPPNPFGLFDMAGNVEELCRDYYHRDAYRRVAAPQSDEERLTAEQVAAGIEAESQRQSLRGGGWNASAKALRAAFRREVRPDRPSTSTGFRYVIEPTDAPEWAKAAFGA